MRPLLPFPFISLLTGVFAVILLRDGKPQWFWFLCVSVTCAVFWFGAWLFWNFRRK